MLQQRWRPALLTLILALGLTVARAEDSPKSSPAPVPVPKCCCEAPQPAVSYWSDACSAPTACPQSPGSASSCSAASCGAENKSPRSTTPYGFVNLHKTKGGPIEQSLETTCSFHFTNTPLRQVLDDLRAMSGLNIVPDEPALADAGINLERPVTLGLKGLSMKKALDLLLHQVQLTYIIQDDVLQITTPSHLARGKLVTKVYSVGDLIQPAHRVGHATPVARTESAAERIVQLITRTIAPPTWSDTGGQGAIQYFPMGQSVAVTQTPEVQEQIVELLTTLRRFREQEAVVAGPTCVPAGPGMVRVMAESTPPAAATVLCRTVAAPTMVAVVHESSKPVVQPWVVGVVVKEGQAQLEVQTGSDTRMVCKEMLLETLGGQLQLCTCDRQVQMTNPFFQAAADRLTRTATDDGVVLEGHVWLQCHEGVQQAEVFAERILVSLKDGRLEIRPIGKVSDLE